MFACTELEVSQKFCNVHCLTIYAFTAYINVMRVIFFVAIETRKVAFLTQVIHNRCHDTELSWLAAIV